MDSKLVSVVMPVHNGEKTIRAAVESVFSQDHILELIVVDDCSTDGTQRILDDFENEIASFKKIIPVDYQKIISAIAGFEEQGISHEDAELEAFKKVTGSVI